jgi:cell division protein FtsX
MKKTLATRVALAIVAVSTVTAAVTGCSAGGSDAASTSSTSKSSSAAKVSADQSKADACAAVKTGLEKLQSMQSEASAAMSDPQKALDLFDQMSDTMSSIKDQVGNPEVKAPVDKAAAAIDDYATFLHDAVKNPTSIDASKVGEKATAITETFTEVGKVCA